MMVSETDLRRLLRGKDYNFAIALVFDGAGRMHSIRTATGDAAEADAIQIEAVITRTLEQVFKSQQAAAAAALN
jgi:hypothetical protein